MNNEKFSNLEHKFIQLAKLLNAYLKHFPKDEKYALTNRIKNNLYDVYEFMVESNKRYQKKTSLTNLDIANEKLKMQVKLAYELGYFNYVNKNNFKEENLEEKRFMRVMELTSEIGRMIGGWINSTENGK